MAQILEATTVKWRSCAREWSGIGEEWNGEVHVWSGDGPALAKRVQEIGRKDTAGLDATGLL